MTKMNQHLHKDLLAEAEVAWYASAALGSGDQIPPSQLQELIYETQTSQDTVCKLGPETSMSSHMVVILTL